jgi:erythromycin esterase-like protein
MIRARRRTPDAPSRSSSLIAEVRAAARPLRSASDLDPLLERIGSARCVLLGEASHGTHEYYTWRDALSRRLIAEKGFSFIAVEGDWPACYHVNRYVRGYPDAGGSARDALTAFERWPTWMWANEEIVELAEWLRQYNSPLGEGRKVGFYGLDVYSLWESLYQIIGYLRRTDGAAFQGALRAFRCFEPYGEDEQEYGWATRLVPESCEQEVIDLLQAMIAKAPTYPQDAREAHYAVEQNALVLKNAEHYYRSMVRSSSESWNVRDRHMAETLDRLLEHHAPQSRAIVWEHNTHIGDARYTDMVEDGTVNIGQLSREHHGTDKVVLVGFGSHHGTVIAGDQWGAPMKRMTVPDGQPGSWEDLLHQAGGDDKLLVFDHLTLGREWYEWRGQRAIGVVYRPQLEKYGNYVPTVLPRRYDAFLYLDRTEALRPLHLRAPAEEEVPETYPSGV